MSRYKTTAGEAAVMQAYDAILADWSIPYESCVVKTSAGHTHLILAGDEAAPPLLLLHGANGNAASWAYVAPEFAKSHRIIAIDIVGQPTRSADSLYPVKKEYHAAWMRSLMDVLGIEKATILGLSFGTWYLLNFYFHHPERFEKMILLSPLAIAPIRFLPIMLQGLKASLSGDYQEMSEFVGTGEEYPKLQSFFIQTARHTKLRSALILPYSDAMLRQIKCPVLLLCGEKDKLIDGKKAVERIKRLLPHAQSQLIPNATHLLPMSEKAVTMPIIQKFLES